MNINTGEMVPSKCASLCRWFLDQPELAGQTISPSPRIAVANWDGVPLYHQNFRAVIEMLESDPHFYARNTDYRTKFNVTIIGDEDLLMWIKMKFL